MRFLLNLLSALEWLSVSCFFVLTFSSFSFEPVRRVFRLRPRLSFTVDAASGSAFVHIDVICFALLAGIDSTRLCAEVGLRSGLYAF